ncbi:MAG TPA: DUF4837 family protein [Flavobacteriales bacterium]|nr:DUF4837 family protein [Flavobacteriales bacterium]
MRRYLFLSLILTIFLGSCSGGSKKTLPGSSGKTHNILVIMDNQDWKNAVGDSIRKYFATEYNDLPQIEPLFSLKQAAPELYNGIFKTVRDVIWVGLGDKPGVHYFKDKFAEPQLIVKIEGRNKDEIKQLIHDHAQEIVNKFKAFEIKNLQEHHRKALRNNEDIEKELGISIEIPDFFVLVDHQKNFFWFRRDLKNGEQDIVLYSVPLKDSLDLKGDRVLYYRDSIGKKFIPGPVDSTYMKSENNISPSHVLTEINGHKAIETRGLWNMKNDFMGGPYINYSIIDKKHKRMVVGEGFIYAPAIDKRDYIVQLEAILKTMKLKD